MLVPLVIHCETQNDATCGSISGPQDFKSLKIRRNLFRICENRVSNNSLITSTIGTSANKGSPVDYFTNMTRGAELEGGILVHLYINLHGSDRPDKRDRREDWYIEQCSSQEGTGEAVVQADSRTPWLCCEWLAAKPQSQQ